MARHVEVTLTREIGYCLYIGSRDASVCDHHADPTYRETVTILMPDLLDEIDRDSFGIWTDDDWMHSVVTALNGEWGGEISYSSGIPGDGTLTYTVIVQESSDDHDFERHRYTATYAPLRYPTIDPAELTDEDIDDLVTTWLSGNPAWIGPGPVLENCPDPGYWQIEAPDLEADDEEATARYGIPVERIRQAVIEYARTVQLPTEHDAFTSHLDSVIADRVMQLALYHERVFG